MEATNKKKVLLFILFCPSLWHRGFRLRLFTAWLPDFSQLIAYRLQDIAELQATARGHYRASLGRLTNGSKYGIRFLWINTYPYNFSPLH